ncbi:hypothetical protein V3F56_04925 [Moorellaceae bacterium AZ2]
MIGTRSLVLDSANDWDDNYGVNLGGGTTPASCRDAVNEKSNPVLLEVLEPALGKGYNF